MGHRTNRAGGAELATSAADAFRGDAVISLLPNDDAMRETFLESDTLDHAGASIHLNMATASIDCTKDLAAVHQECGVSYVAATVYGRPEMAAERNLNILAARDPATIERVQPLFDAMGKKT